MPHCQGTTYVFHVPQSSESGMFFHAGIIQSLAQSLRAENTCLWEENDRLRKEVQSLCGQLRGRWQLETTSRMHVEILQRFNSLHAEIAELRAQTETLRKENESMKLEITQLRKF